LKSSYQVEIRITKAEADKLLKVDLQEQNQSVGTLTTHRVRWKGEDRFSLDGGKTYYLITEADKFLRVDLQAQNQLLRTLTTHRVIWKGENQFSLDGGKSYYLIAEA